jgi:myo-inositol 2-dehydrogenase/D-chiro-inositol 1-dehydrogenase
MKTQFASQTLPRRRFLSATAGAATVTLLRPSLVFGTENQSVVTLGLIGCGGRGNWLTKYFSETGKYKFVACADYFADKANATGEKLGIAANRRCSGLMGYRRLLASPLDAVVIESPPHFHPQHAADAVSAGKHVFLAKPIAVDVPGCLTIADAGKRATEKKLVFLVDFQTRANEHFREALRLVRAGAIGKPVLAEAHYPWRGGGRGEPPATREQQLRNWYYVKALSGDFIVEQSIHSLDVATWILNADPIRAIGFGGRKVRPPGSINDHFAVQYIFPDEVPLAFTCIQSIPEVKDEIRARVFGTDGVIDTDYYTDVWVRGKEFYKGTNPELYTTGAQDNIREFHQFVTQGKCDNPTVAPSVRSNLTAILGRDAGYQRGELTWAAMMQQAQKLEFNLEGLAT